MTTEKSNSLSEIKKKIAIRIKQAINKKIGKKVDYIARVNSSINHFYQFEQDGIKVCSNNDFNTTMPIGGGSNHHKIYPISRSVTKDDKIVFLEEFDFNTYAHVLNGSEITKYVPGQWEEKLDKFYEDAKRKNEERRQEKLNTTIKDLEKRAMEEFGI